MRALGLAVELPSPNRPTLRAVVLSDANPPGSPPSLADISVEEFFEVTTAETVIEVQLRDMSEAISGRIRGLDVDLVVVRRADMPPKSSNADGPRKRLLGTGAVTAAARLLVDRTRLRNGKECGAAYGSNKEGVDADAKTLVPAKFVSAAAAALAGLHADRV
jgi:hypothetical protein